jgi:hypothetical protein
MAGDGTPSSVSAPAPAGLVADLMAQNDLQIKPGTMGLQVFVNSAVMPVTAQRATPLPTGPDGSEPAPADVAGWRPVLSDLASGGPALGDVTAGTLYAGYAPAGSFALSVDGHGVAARPAFGWAAQYRTGAGRASLGLSQFPLVPLGVTVELLVWVALALALIGRRRRARTTGASVTPVLAETLETTHSVTAESSGEVS